MVRFKCPECNVECIFDDRTYEYICPNCGLVVDDSRLAYDEYYNVAFLDDYKGRVESSMYRRLRKNWRQLLKIEHYTRGGSNYVAMLVKSKLMEIEPKYRSLLLDVEAGSLNELFKNYLLITGYPYELAREKFLLACELADVEKPKLRPVNILSPSISKFRVNKRFSRIIEEVESIVDGEVKMLIEGLMNLPDFQPLNVKALKAACEKWIHGEVKVKNYSVRAAGRYLKLLRRLSKINAYILASKYAFSLQQICLIKKLNVKAVRESMRRGLKIVNAMNGEFYPNLGFLCAMFPSIGEIHFKLAAKYSSYSSYVRVCRTFGVEALNRRLYGKIRDYFEISRLLHFFDESSPIDFMKDEFNLIILDQSSVNFQSYIDLFNLDSNDLLEWWNGF